MAILKVLTRSLFDWEMRFGRNKSPGGNRYLHSLFDWEMRSGRNAAVYGLHAAFGYDARTCGGVRGRVVQSAPYSMASLARKYLRA